MSKKVIPNICEKCGWIKQQCECDRPMTNADRIRAMSDEELADSRVDRIDFYTKSDIPEYIGDFNGIANGIEEAIALEIKWLQSEAKEVNNTESCEPAQPSWKDQMLRKFLGRRQ